MHWHNHQSAAAKIYTLIFSVIVCVGNLLMAEICGRVADAISFDAWLNMDRSKVTVQETDFFHDHIYNDQTHETD